MYSNTPSSFDRYFEGVGPSVLCSFQYAKNLSASILRHLRRNFVQNGKIFGFGLSGLSHGIGKIITDKKLNGRKYLSVFDFVDTVFYKELGKGSIYE